LRRINPSGFRVARRGTSREINRQIALNLVRERQPISRAELARVMGVRPGAVSLLVNELLESGLVFEGAKGVSKVGRRPMYLHIETRRRYAMAVDVSVGRTSLMATDLVGRPLLDVSTFPTPPRPQPWVRDAARHIQRIFESHPELGECEGVGVVVPGMVDLHGGRLKHCPTLGWRDVDIVEPLRHATRLPVFVENWCKACVLAQVWAIMGDIPMEGPVAFVNVSDGVGVGIAIDGKLLRGAHNISGEFGHVALNMYGPRCSCGQRGCWEAYVSQRATTARYLGADPSWSGSAEPSEPTVEEIVARARAGEAKAIETLRETGHYLGRGIATIVKTIDPSRVYVGGDITLGWDVIESSVREAVREQALIHEVGETDIRVVPLEEHPRLRGAAALVSAPAFAAPVVA
jgi:predicted NBD/HSP70 family sugar kinase